MRSWSLHSTSAARGRGIVVFIWWRWAVWGRYTWYRWRGGSWGSGGRTVLGRWSRALPKWRSTFVEAVVESEDQPDHVGVISEIALQFRYLNLLFTLNYLFALLGEHFVLDGIFREWLVELFLLKVGLLIVLMFHDYVCKIIKFIWLVLVFNKIVWLLGQWRMLNSSYLLDDANKGNAIVITIVRYNKDMKDDMNDDIWYVWGCIFQHYNMWEAWDSKDNLDWISEILMRCDWWDEMNYLGDCMNRIVNDMNGVYILY